jgi:hypothetical protein
MQTTPLGPPSPIAPTPSRRSTLFYALIGIGLGLVAAGGVAAVLVYQAVFARPAAIPTLLGADTQLYATLTPNLSDLPNVQRLQEAYPQLFVDQDSSDADDQLEDLMGVSFAEDIQPWIGTEMAIAVSGIDADRIAEAQQDSSAGEEILRRARVIIVLAARDQAKAQAFLDKQRTNRAARGEEFVETTHQNITIYTQQDAEGSPIAAFALIKQHVVFASDPAQLTEMIDRDGGGEDTLEKNTRFQKVKAALPSAAAGYVFADGPLIADTAVAALRQSAESLDSSAQQEIDQQIDNARAIEGLGASISVAETGVQLDTAVAMDLSELDDEAQAQIEATRQPVDADRLGSVSRDAIGLMSFHIPATFKDQVLEAIRIQPDGEAQLESFEQETGVNLEDDILNWFSGDATLVFLPGEQIGDTTLPATGYFSIRPADRDAAERGMAKIAEAITQSSDGTTTFAEEEFGGVQWQTISDPASEQVFGGYGFVQDDLVIAFGTTALTSAGAGGEAALTSEANFTAVNEKLVSPNGGVIYIDMARAVEAYRAAGLLPEDFDDSDADKSLRPIKAIGAAGAPGLDEQGVGRARLFVFIE